MKNLYLFIAFILSVSVVSGQLELPVQVAYTDDAPDIDGIEEDLWDAVPANYLDSSYVGENPTVTAYWKALWDDNALYVLVNVVDDDHWPSWVSGGSWFQFDQPELYLDVNDELEDLRGAGTNRGTGHYQVQPGFVDGGSGVKKSLVEDGDYRPGGSYCYVITGEDYVFEYALDYSTFMNIGGDMLSVGDFVDLDEIGFDVYVIDQDEGVTTARQRAVWSNTGRVDENYANMDDAGTIVLIDFTSVDRVHSKPGSLVVYPNPVYDYLTIDAEFDKLTITNVLGKEIKSIVYSDNKIDVNSLARGIYFIQAFDKGISLGVAKILKM
jgi:hypothetical protein